MSLNEILADLRRRPFEPFQLIVSDGTTYDILHPDQCLVLMTAVIVPLRPAGGTQPVEDYTKIDCRHIVRTVNIPPTASPPGTNGQSPAA